MKLLDIFKPKMKNKWIKGINSNKSAFIGPRIAQIDITNNCNLNCVGCWCHSDLMEELKFKGDFKEKKLDFEKIINLIDCLKKLGTTEIQLSGSGDPSMHPDFMKTVKYIKKNNFKLNIVTNFTLIDKKKIAELIEYKVDLITVSLWAGTAKTYVKTHPNQTKKTFERIKSNLSYLKSIKKTFPKIKIYNVISKLNYLEIEKMVDFALNVRAEYIEFQAIDTVIGKSEHLKLTDKDKKKIKEAINNLLNRDMLLDVPEEDNLKKSLNESHINEAKEFKRIVNKSSLKSDFNYFLDYIKCYETTCREGYSNSFVKEDNKVENCLKFFFDKNTCLKCKKLNDCSIDKKDFSIKVEFLSVLGFGTFFRRTSNLNHKKQYYDINIVDTMPCYIGWTYTRILPNGDVIPCCKAHKKPLGNLNKNSFKEIWFSARYNEFRYLAKAKKKSHEYFKEIDCYKSCDNVGMNLKTHMEIKRLKL